jgi:hypothetical protein
MAKKIDGFIPSCGLAECVSSENIENHLLVQSSVEEHGRTLFWNRVFAALSRKNKLWQLAFFNFSFLLLTSEYPSL